jgi:1-acyl-sn-glycerol-3-phosphate acyltransferase
MSGAPPLPAGSWPWLHDLSRWLGSWGLYVVYRLRVRGRGHVPPGGAVVLVANHSAFMDGPLLFGQLGRRSVFLVKHESFHGPLGWYLRRLGQLPVRRGEVDRAPLLTALRTLRAGGVVGVFPEGTRGAGDVEQARQGAAWLARSAGAVVLPVACRGTRTGGGGPLPRWRPRVDVLIGPPVPVPAERGRAALAAATERIRVELAAQVAELDRLRAGTLPSTVDRRAEAP